MREETNSILYTDITALLLFCLLSPVFCLHLLLPAKSLPEQISGHSCPDDQRADARILPICNEGVGDDADASEDEQRRYQRIERHRLWSRGIWPGSAKHDQGNPCQSEEDPVSKNGISE